MIKGILHHFILQQAHLNPVLIVNGNFKNLIIIHTELFSKIQIEF